MPVNPSDRASARTGVSLDLTSPAGSPAPAGEAYETNANSKTTTIRLIAGFEIPTSGRISLADVDVTDYPPYKREVNTVFQDYALFPHMTISQNVGYGLRGRRCAEERDRDTC